MQRVSKIQRTVETMQFVRRTYQTVHNLKCHRLAPRQAGETLAHEASMMGPLYIKLAQFISSRGDAVDPEFAEALSVVQDRAPLFDMLHTKPPYVPGYIVETRPIASASIADVYKGKEMSSGMHIVVKQRRAGVKDRVTTDLPLLLGIMWMASVFRVPGARNVYELVNESQTMLLSELDFKNESAAATEFRALYKDVSWLVVPRVMHATEDIMISEYVPSHNLGAIATPNPELAQRLMNLYMIMLETGFLHADPHPGNIGFLQHGGIVLYDFGAMLRVDPQIRGQVAKLLQAALVKDAESLLSSLEGMGVVSIKSGQRTSVRRALRRAIDGNMHEELQNSPEFTSTENRVVTFGATFIYLARTLSLIDGSCRRLDPAFTYDYSRWVDDRSMGVDVVEALRDVTSIPATMHTMHHDLEEFQVRIIKEIEDGKRTSLIMAVLAAGAYFFLF